MKFAMQYFEKQIKKIDPTLQTMIRDQAWTQVFGLEAWYWYQQYFNQAWYAVRNIIFLETK